MSNVIKFIKKAFTLGVVSTTIVWSSMVSVLLPSVATAAVCPTLNPGDMLKVTGKPAIYVVNNKNEVMYFPSGDEFKSWRPTYGGYTSVSMECFDSLKLPSVPPLGVNFHSGSYIVKRPSSDQLYVVETNNTLAKITPEAAKALYGTGYKVMTVGDPFWPNYVNRGTDVTEAKAHPGMLVKNGGKTWYVDSDMKLWEVSETGLTANGFQAKFAMAVADSAVAGLMSGGKLEAELKTLTDKTQSGGVVAPAPGSTPAASGSLSVALASDNPFAATIVSDDTSDAGGAQAMIPVLKLVLTAGGDGDAKVTSLKLKRSGVSADTDIGNMYLYDGDMQLASNPSILNNMITFSNSAGLFTVAKSSSKTVLVKLDLKNAVSSGKTFMFSLNAAGDLAPTASSGSFPLSGNTFTTAQVTDLGKLVLANVSPTAAGTVDPGQTAFEIWKFKATNSNQDMELRKLKLTIVGSVSVGDLKNFKLMDGGTQLGTTVAEMAADKTVNFDLMAAPYTVTKGQIKNLSLSADIVAGTNRTFYASIQNSGDVITYDKNYGLFVKTNSLDSFTTVQAGGSTSVNWTINTGTLTQTVPATSPTGNIPDGGTSIELAKFSWKANGEDIKVSSLSVSSTSAGSTDNILANVRLLVGGSQVGTTISSLTANGAANTGWGTFGNSFIIKAGTSVEVKVVADTTDSTVAAGETFVAGLVLGSSNAQGVVSLTSISTVAQNANTLTVRAGTVTVTKNVAFGDKTAANPTGPVNAVNVKVGSMVITAGAGEEVTMSQIVLGERTASTCVGTSLQNLVLKDGTSGAQLGQTYASPATSCATIQSYAFNISPAVTISNGGQYVVDVYADLKASLSATALIDVKSVTASGKTTGSDASVTAQTVALQNVSISGSGNLMIQTDSDTPVASNFLMGDVNQTVARFKVSASSTEAVNITQLVVSAKFSTGATTTMKNIRLVDDVTGLQVGSAVASFNDTVAGTSAATSTFSHATFTGLNLQIPKGVSKVLLLKVDFTSYEDAGLSTTGQTFEAAILGTYYGTTGNNPVTVTGASSGSSLTAVISDTNSANNYSRIGTGAYATTGTLYRTKLSVAWASDTPSGAASPATAQVVAKFVITNKANSGAYESTVNFVDFDLSTTISQAGGVGSSRALTVYKDSLSTTALGSTNFITTQTFGVTRFRDGGITDVSISSGGSKVFYVTLDTTDAAQSKSLSIRIAAGTTAAADGGVHWTDGVQSVGNIVTMSQDLPLIYKTFTY